MNQFPSIPGVFHSFCIGFFRKFAGNICKSRSTTLLTTPMAKLPPVLTTALANCRAVGTLRTSPLIFKRLARKIAIVKKQQKSTQMWEETLVRVMWAGVGGAGRDIHMVLPEPSSCLCIMTEWRLICILFVFIYTTIFTNGEKRSKNSPKHVMMHCKNLELLALVVFSLQLCCFMFLVYRAAESIWSFYTVRP